MTLTIDAHQHFWRTAAQHQPWRAPEHAALECDFEPSDLLPELKAAGIDSTVVMQSVDEHAENERLAEYATAARVGGVVGWVPLHDARAAVTELSSMSIPKLCGIRSLIADDPIEWLTSPNTVAFFRDAIARGLAWDVVPITAEQTRQVIKLAELLPDLRIIVDHLGRPPLDSDGWEPWATNMTELAQSPGVAVKVSVGINALTAWRAWDEQALQPYVQFACEQFGARRLMLASNWPVVLLRTSYERAWKDLTTLIDMQFSDAADRDEVLGGTAVRYYQLELDLLESGGGTATTD